MLHSGVIIFVTFNKQKFKEWYIYKKQYKTELICSMRSDVILTPEQSTNQSEVNCFLLQNKDVTS